MREATSPHTCTSRASAPHPWLRSWGAQLLTAARRRKARGLEQGMLALAAHIALSYCTLLPFLGFFIRLTKSIILNDALTLFYAIVYWAPFSFVMNVYARLFLSRKVATFRSTRPSFLKKGAYEYSAATDIFYSKDYSNLDDSLEEWGAVEYLPFVYNAVLNKYNTRLNFKQVPSLNLTPLLDPHPDQPRFPVPTGPARAAARSCRPLDR